MSDEFEEKNDKLMEGGERGGGIHARKFLFNNHAVRKLLLFGKIGQANNSA